MLRFLWIKSLEHNSGLYKPNFNIKTSHHSIRLCLINCFMYSKYDTLYWQGYMCKRLCTCISSMLYFSTSSSNPVFSMKSHTCLSLRMAWILFTRVYFITQFLSFQVSLLIASLKLHVTQDGQ
jgi:hypothetical protein